MFSNPSPIRLATLRLCAWVVLCVLAVSSSKAFAAALVGTGGIEQKFHYDAFGNVTTLVPDAGNPTSFVNAANTSGPRYHGQLYDAGTDQVYLRHRYYSPGLGRFNTMDPARDGHNHYNYAGSDPVNRWDPMGLYWRFYARKSKLGFTLSWEWIEENNVRRPGDAPTQAQKATALLALGEIWDNTPFAVSAHYDLPYAYYPAISVSPKGGSAQELGYNEYFDTAEEAGKYRDNKLAELRGKRSEWVKATVLNHVTKQRMTQWFASKADAKAWSSQASSQWEKDIKNSKEYEEFQRKMGSLQDAADSPFSTVLEAGSPQNLVVLAVGLAKGDSAEGMRRKSESKTVEYIGYTAIVLSTAVGTKMAANSLAGGASAPKRIVSRIGANRRLINEAIDAGASHQGELDSLFKQLSQGNMNPGIGSKFLFNGIHEARGRTGARLYFRMVGDTLEILGKSTKANQDKVINTLKSLYGD